MTLNLSLTPFSNCCDTTKASLPRRGAVVTFLREDYTLPNLTFLRASVPGGRLKGIRYRCHVEPAEIRRDNGKP